jgi:acetyl/propionyl-CoA carboxylase alpha subunit/acetyl-CoA carboxylase carboxyltransferase component
VIFQRVAIVNRGEPAVRLINAVNELNAERATGIQTIALYTEPDATAMFVREADDHYALGPAWYETDDGRRRLSYLDYARLENALVATKADAAWVGWGFVAEHAEFAALCKRLGVVFIGPSPDVMERLGDKIAAKQIAERAGVPVAPWSGGPVIDVTEAHRVAETLGYPLMLKAASGGGGRGIRHIDRAADLAKAFASARAEAASAFGDDTVFLERRVDGARHIEVQIIGDQYGTVWPVGVRDCSVQRRHQKLLEEAPSPALTPDQDHEIRAAAARLGAAAGYQGAGTVEFLFDDRSGAYSFMEVNTRLQVEHPITEVTTGVDLVKLQLLVAAGLALEGDPPPTIGHAIEARLNAEDPDRGFSPAPGVVEHLRYATGPGIRVDTGVEEMDAVASEFDSMVAKIIAVGSTREEARSRLARALRQSRVVIRDGTTNKAFLQRLLAEPDYVAGAIDVGWVDRLLASDPQQDGEIAAAALISAAITAYSEQLKTEMAAFRDAAGRGRPEIGAGIGQAVKLRYGRRRYEIDVREIAPNTYELHVDGLVIPAQIELLGASGRRLHCGGRSLRVLSVVHGATHIVEVDGLTHRITHDEGGVIRAPSPSVVVSLEVARGDVVQPGDRLAVIEAMKMETAITAEIAGTVRSVEIAENTQVATGTPLIIIDPAEDDVAGTARVTAHLESFAATDAALDHRGCRHYLETLRWMLLGWDVSPATVSAMIAPGSDSCPGGGADPEVRALEDEVIAIFVDVISLFRRALPDELVTAERRTTEEYLFDYLRDLGAHRGDLPERFTTQLLRTLRHYGVASLDHTTPELIASLFRITKSQSRMAEQTVALLTVLEDRLSHVDDAGLEFEQLLTRLIHETQGRYPAVHDIAQELRYRAFDMPFLEEIRQRRYAEVDELIARIEQYPDRPDRADIIGRLVDCPQPLKPRLTERFADAPPRLKETLLEVMTRRYYRIRPLGPFTSTTDDRFVFTTSEYPFDGRQIHVVSARIGYEELSAGLAALRRVVEVMPQEHDVVVDIYIRRSDSRDTPAIVEDSIRTALGRAVGSLRLRRIVAAVSGPDAGESLAGVLNFTYRPGDDDTYVEDTQYRDLHPMMAKRLDLWRLANFEHRRLPSLADIYFFHAVAKDNPADERLIALGEVRDLTAVRDDDGRIVRVPEFERIFRDALGPIRHYQAHRKSSRRLQWNRVMLYVWPVLPFSAPEVEDIINRLARETEGLGLERVQVRVRMRMPGDEIRARLIEISNPGGRQLRLRLRRPPTEPLQPLTAFDQTLVRLRQRGLHHPIDIVDALAPPLREAGYGIPHGRFVEHELDGEGLVAVDRPAGSNPSNVVVGTVTNITDRYPDGMERVVVLGDPTRGMGNVAEPECRRIIAAMDLAAERGIPLEWFALSAGARISMESGTENMDWIGRVLRRIIEFTQAGHELNVIVTGINVGAQPYWNAEATMLMHTRGILVMTPNAAMVLTGKQALDYSGGVSAEDNRGIGGYERIMGPNGQAQYFARDVTDACRILLQHYEYAYVAPGERFPRRSLTNDPVERDVRSSPHGGDFPTIGDVFSPDRNPDRKRPFEIRKLIDAVIDHDHDWMERWHGMQHAETAITGDAFIGGYAVTLIGLESKPVPRLGFIPADGPKQWTSGTLFPVASKKVARAINAASGNRPVVVLANLSGFDGSPESMRRWQLEYGAEIGRAVVNFDGPLVFCVVSRYHGGAFVVFSKTLSDNMEVAALEGARASVIGGAPAAAVVFAREVRHRVEADPRIVELRRRVAESEGAERNDLVRQLDELREVVTADARGAMAEHFDTIHSVQRAKQVGSIDHILPVVELRPYLIGAIERGIDRTEASGGR